MNEVLVSKYVSYMVIQISNLSTSFIYSRTMVSFGRYFGFIFSVCICGCNITCNLGLWTVFSPMYFYRAMLAQSAVMRQ